MSLAIAILGAIIAIFSIIILHELGHFVVACACGIKVLRFSIGFGKALCKWKGKSGTEYILALLPLGGYVKMLGEGDEITSAKDAHRAFNQKPLFIRMLVVLAGPFTNFLLALISFWGVYLMGVTHTRPIVGEVVPHSIAAQAGIKPGDELVEIDGKAIKNWQQALMAIIALMGDRNEMEMMVKPQNSSQESLRNLELLKWNLDQRSPDVFKSLGLLPYQPRIPPVINSVMKGSPAERAQLQQGDRVKAINGQPVKDWLEVVNIVRQKPNEKIQLTVTRNDKTHLISLTTGKKYMEETTVGYLGVLSQPPPQWPDNLIYKEEYSFWGAWRSAVEQTWRLLTFNAMVMVKMIIGKVSIHTLGGPITVFQAAGKAIQAGFQVYLGFIGFISLTIGFINLLPIPGLDGGHLLFQIIEGLFRRPVPERIQIISLTLGVVFFIFLMVQATINDIARLFSFIF
ncbi:RIP metalloprotease RseP [Candidatus Coxiella mudrowiae]|uniref:Zinc metalloprotease n=1 Tax=Candidatus Coxiella mudrowiae TaxID=2054173 RepID=A0ABN4HPR5_9COXI|nr:RIP metalloprotease RseP [Candidatus Coxiella mudrowiae]AKQ33573.1 Protease ecfE [Candidatus Coxiella mudrowiae]